MFDRSWIMPSSGISVVEDQYFETYHNWCNSLVRFMWAKQISNDPLRYQIYASFTMESKSSSGCKTLFLYSIISCLYFSLFGNQWFYDLIHWVNHRVFKWLTFIAINWFNIVDLTTYFFKSSQLSLTLSCLRDRMISFKRLFSWSS